LTKSELRILYLQKRLALSEAEYLHLNRLICDRFFSSVDLSFIKVIHIFLPILEKREVDTWLIIDRIHREFPHICLSIPKINADGEMENIYFENLHQLKKNNWGIEEPEHGIPTPVEKIDLVVVPLLCFDSKGNRVGYGKGYYDRFLTKCKIDTTKIGLSIFDATIDPISDIHEFDIRLNSIISPKEKFTF
jgi:5-formyltetrahydrofolate cyclo-ligase